MKLEIAARNPRTATCPTHGKVDGNFHCATVTEPTYSTGPICPKCYVDWVRANVAAVQQGMCS